MGIHRENSNILEKDVCHKTSPVFSTFKVMGCKAYVKLPQNFIRKDLRDKSLVENFIGYSKESKIWYKVYKTVVGFHLLFDEIILCIQKYITMKLRN